MRGASDNQSSNANDNANDHGNVSSYAPARPDPSVVAFLLPKSQPAFRHYIFTFPQGCYYSLKQAATQIKASGPARVSEVAPWTRRDYPSIAIQTTPGVAAMPYDAPSTMIHAL
jgi:hypothetical protein